jgi:hypothetical protein
MLSDLAVVRPAAPCLESTATQHDDNPGGDGEKQDIFQTNATHWHGQPLPAALCDSLIMTKTMARKRDAIVAGGTGGLFSIPPAPGRVPVEVSSSPKPRFDPTSARRCLFPTGTLLQPGPVAWIIRRVGALTVRLVTVGVKLTEVVNA